MNIPQESADLENVTRFLHRFADLVSKGSNAENLLRAAKLLEVNANRASEAEDLLRQESSKCANVEGIIDDLKTQLATLRGVLPEGNHVLVPASILRLAASQFEALADAFEKSGNVVSQAMCEASASTLSRALATEALASSSATARSGGG
jgi:hypothetical protein